MARHPCRSRSQSRSAKGEGKQKGKGKDEEPPNVAHTSLVYALNSAQQNNSERIQTPWTEATYVGLVRFIVSDTDSTPWTEAEYVEAATSLWALDAMLVSIPLQGPDGMQRDMEEWLDDRQWAVCWGPQPFRGGS